MSLTKTKQHLIAFLDESENKVIALTGLWGTGKSELWREIRGETSQTAVKNAVYASLFGLSSLDQVKWKLCQTTFPVNLQGSIADRIKGVFSSTTKVLEGFHKAFASLNDLGLLLAPSILSKKLIVLDDIERKHDKLSIDELLGFINDFSENHECRFLLILNLDQLKEQILWEVLREKVVDQEIQLQTEPIEAIDIAFRNFQSPYKAAIASAIDICAVSNIRIIQKIIRAANKILGTKKDYSESLLQRVVPSIVLLAAIHYKGLEDGPSKDFVLRYLPTRNTNGNQNNEKHAQWSLLLQRLGIYGSDEFETLVVEYLQSGLLDTSAIDQTIERYIKEEYSTDFSEKCRQFRDNYFWRPDLSERALYEEVAALLSDVTRLDAATITWLHEAASTLPGGVDLANRAMTAWIEHFNSKDHTGVSFESWFVRDLHPDIQSAFKKAKENNTKLMPIIEALRKIADKRGWGERERDAINHPAEHDYINIIKTTVGSDLRFLMLMMIDFVKNRPTYESSFGPGMDKFIRACQTLISDASSGRLKRLIEQLFVEEKLEWFLEASNPVL